MKLLGSGPDMVAELKDGDRAEGGAEGGLPQRIFGGQAAGFWGTSLLGRRCLGGWFQIICYTCHSLPNSVPFRLDGCE